MSDSTKLVEVSSLLPARDFCLLRLLNPLYGSGSQGAKKNETCPSSRNDHPFDGEIDAHYGEQKTMLDSFELPSVLPVPGDDGACSHLTGLQIPDISLASTTGESVNLARIGGRTILFCYPRTGEPGQPVPKAWDEIPGARGCTPQCCGFRDSYSELKSAGANHVFGLSTQDTDYQREAANRLNLPYPLLSDRDLKLARALTLPTFEFNLMTLIKRLTLIIDEGRITHVFYPVFPPDQSASQTLKWLKANPS